MNPARQRALDYVAAFGLDGTEISEEISPEGFCLIRQGADRDRVHPWPYNEGFDYDWLVRLLEVARAEDLRVAGVKAAKRADSLYPGIAAGIPGLRL